MESLDGGDLVLNLQCQLKSLRDRVEELELENARLSSQIAACCGKKVEDKIIRTNIDAEVNGNSVEEVLGSCDEVRDKNMYPKGEIGPLNEPRDKNMKKKTKVRTSGCSLRTSHYPTKRYVALKLMYFGQRYYGFASEGQMDPTVESEIFKALEKTKLLVGEKKDLLYSRCGRTDKGVSSIGQVISLFLRSKLKDSEGHVNYEKIALKELCAEEIDYVRVLNRVLPKDIRVIGWCPAPSHFHARFSCLSREYKYLFWRKSLDISAMEIAGKQFVGEHDFRNFCKMDAANVHNYRRKITSFEISSCNERSVGDEVWTMTIRGSAFLWHQVRCVVAVLFMIGQGLECPSVVHALLDIDKTPRKPQYTMAPELPLILQSCEFEGLNFICSSDAGRALHEHLKTEFESYILQAAIFHEALNCLALSGALTGISVAHSKKKSSHIPLKLRPTEPSYEERRTKLYTKANCKSPLISDQEPLTEMEALKSTLRE